MITINSQRSDVGDCVGMVQHWQLMGGRVLIGLTSLVLLATGCAPATHEVSTLTNALPGPDIVSGWAPEGDVQAFSVDTLFDLVNGQAESYFAYGFEAAADGRYRGPQSAVLRIEIFRLASPDDAFGLFSVSVAGEPIAIGADGDTDPGRRLAFWQDRHYVRIVAPQPVADADLMAFGQAVAGALPPGGQPPELVSALPTTGLVPLTIRFFHQELSIQNWLWLGGDNVLGLDAGTDGVLADYERDSETAKLLLVVYPKADQATTALQVLESRAPSGLVVAEVRGRKLGAVFGNLAGSTAGDLLNEALQ